MSASFWIKYFLFFFFSSALGCLDIFAFSKHINTWRVKVAWEEYVNYTDKPYQARLVKLLNIHVTVGVLCASFAVKEALGYD